MRLSPWARFLCLLAAFAWVVAVMWWVYGNEVVHLVTN